MIRRFARLACGVVTNLLVGGAAAAQACPVCFGAEDSPLVDGTKAGVWVMLAITIAVQAAFVGFFLYLRKRAKLLAEVELDSEWANLQKVTR
jgi:hypothetical protein